MAPILTASDTLCRRKREQTSNISFFRLPTMCVQSPQQALNIGQPCNIRWYYLFNATAHLQHGSLICLHHTEPGQTRMAYLPAGTLVLGQVAVTLSWTLHRHPKIWSVLPGNSVDADGCPRTFPTTCLLLDKFITSISAMDADPAPTLSSLTSCAFQCSWDCCWWDSCCHCFQNSVRAAPQNSGRLAVLKPRGSKLWKLLHSFCVFAVAFAMAQGTVFIYAGWWECENDSGYAEGARRWQKREKNREDLRFVFSWFCQCSPEVLQKNPSNGGGIPGILGIYVQSST